MISDLQKLFIRVKKFPDTTIIQLSQMNRNIENPERINNPSMLRNFLIRKLIGNYSIELFQIH